MFMLNIWFHPQDIGSLSDLFHVGQPIRCKVVSMIGGGKKGQPRAKLTVNPADVNMGLSPTLLKNGMVGARHGSDFTLFHQIFCEKLKILRKA